jgi:hypothetical protein
MDFSPEDRVFLLFVSERCPLVERLCDLYCSLRLRKPPKGKDPVLRVSTETLRLWRNGAVRMPRQGFADILFALAERTYQIATTKAHGRNAQTLQGLHDRLQELRDLVLKQAADSYRAGELLMYSSKTAVQHELDVAFYRRRPLLASAIYDLNIPLDKRTATEHEQQYVGTYHLFVERSSARTRSEWWLCPMRVRYLLRLSGQIDGSDQQKKTDAKAVRSSRAKPDLAFLRVKLTVPTTQLRGGKNWDYDGALAVNGGGFSSTLETRSRSARDVFQLTMTPLDHHGENTFAVGRFVTIDQAGSRAVIAGRALLHMQSGWDARTEEGWAQEAMSMMRAGAKRLQTNDPELATLERLQREASKAFAWWR